MYIGKKRIKEHNYLYVFESVRKGDKVTKKTIAYVGPVGMGRKAAEESLRRLEKAGRIRRGAGLELPNALVLEKRVRTFTPKAGLDDAVPDEIKDEVHDVLKTLQEHGIDFLVGGMTTINAYLGMIRVSQDVDIFVMSKRSIGSIRYVLEQAGFKVNKKRTANYLPVFSKTLKRGESIVDITTEKSFNITMTEDSAKHSVPLKLNGLELRGMSIEEILLTKQRRNIERDKEDIADIKEYLEKDRIALDWEFVGDRAQDLGCSTQLEQLKAVFGIKP